MPSCHPLNFCNSTTHYLELVLRELPIFLTYPKLVCLYAPTNIGTHFYQCFSTHKKLSSSRCLEHLTQKALSLTYPPPRSALPFLAVFCFVLSKKIFTLPLIQKTSYEHSQIPTVIQRTLDDYQKYDSQNSRNLKQAGLLFSIQFSTSLSVQVFTCLPSTLLLWYTCFLGRKTICKSNSKRNPVLNEILKLNTVKQESPKATENSSSSRETPIY